MVDLREKLSASWYNTLHPISRRDWLKCLPPGGVYLKILIRLRSGFGNIGQASHYRVESRCPFCGSHDTVEHLLLSCISLYEQRCTLMRIVSGLTDLEPTIELLLGFGPLPNKVLRKITIATAQFVCASGRRV